MAKKAVFLDRDGTLTVDPGYVHKVKDFKLHDGVIEGLKLLKDYKLFIITNQSGIGRGYYSEEDMHRFNEHMLDEFSKHEIKIEKIYFCPHDPTKEKCDCRKPGIKNIRKAEKEFNLDLRKSYVIGDHDFDIQMGKDVGAKAVYLLTGHGIRHLDEARKLNPDYIAANLKQAAGFIIFNKMEKIVSRAELKNIAEKLKQRKKKIVTLNGAFDILHKGHEKILSEAKKQGDILIAGVNSDLSVKENKGPERPVNNEKSRAKMLANFDYVDYITIFDEKTPINLLEIIKPDVHVNGSDYGENCIEADIVKRNGGRIHVVELLEGYSTSNLIGNP